jgi:hypothetical protein
MEFLRTQPPARLENLWAGCQVSAAPGPHARTAPGRSPGVSCWPVRSARRQGDPMLDITMLTIGLGFLVLSIGYATFCERL